MHPGQQESPAEEPPTISALGRSTHVRIHFHFRKARRPGKGGYVNHLGVDLHQHKRKISCNLQGLAQCLTIESQLALQQAEKLKRLTPWLLSVKRSVEALNQCVENFADENGARQQVTDVFDPLLNLLTGMIKFQRTYLAGKFIFHNPGST